MPTRRMFDLALAVAALVHAGLGPVHLAARRWQGQEGGVKQLIGAAFRLGAGA